MITKTKDYITLAQAAELSKSSVRNILKRKTCIYRQVGDQTLVLFDYECMDVYTKMERVPYSIEHLGQTYYLHSEYIRRNQCAGTNYVDQIKRKFNNRWRTYRLYDNSVPEVDGQPLVQICQHKEELSGFKAYEVAHGTEGPWVKLRNRWYGLLEKVQEFKEKKVMYRLNRSTVKESQAYDSVQVSGTIELFKTCVTLGMTDIRTIGQMANNLFNHAPNRNLITEAMQHATIWGGKPTEEKVREMYPDGIRGALKKVFKAISPYHEMIPTLSMLVDAGAETSIVRAIFNTIVQYLAPAKVSLENTVEAYTKALFPEAKFEFSPEFVLNRGIWDEDLSPTPEYLAWIEDQDYDC